MLHMVCFNVRRYITTAVPVNRNECKELDWTCEYNYFLLRLETVKIVHADLYNHIMMMK
jgi:hypothetical protein